ncbi:MAG: DNA mismatch repair protein MutS [Sphingomonadales bacterium]|nr:MAG: DNA mismatch repair protein MutS [Sphingomonadales bacterium]
MAAGANRHAGASDADAVRRLAPEEAALWQLVIASVKPIAGRKAAPKPVAAPIVAPSPKAAPAPRKMKPAPPPAPPPPRTVTRSSNTLDGSWDRQLSRGLVSPESAIDLHGHSLSSAYDRLDRGLEQAIAQGDRVLLLVTGKPPRPESERPHARGAIRAAVGDWLASSRHAGRIAAVRGAHPRHGGTGALYIVLRRPNLSNVGKQS